MIGPDAGSKLASSALMIKVRRSALKESRREQSESERCSEKDRRIASRKPFEIASHVAHALAIKVAGHTLDPTRRRICVLSRSLGEAAVGRR